ncbi:5-formyltetrahydrofolate cyclo-ligase [Gloeothece citriformis PCC 7424]|uniref:5-formyltetrahydrofolate cyclo-ligase n=1 Tax=Gloeothece citriformis (strain PCC 7424) TaxID=65393 RepID=B7KBT3_GLOC7|nr:5-formyltetrahydrofolate cyclo-ligase [Gloeothece citriformis]ACK73061.1 5-formyltetrahydrofolate cyclo-ligase [Gloeothece citriformis PCC 7424]
MKSQFTKAQLRKQLLQTRRSLPQTIWQEKSDKICDNLQSLPLFIQAKTVLAYISFRQEPNLSPLFSLNYQWGFPRCVEKSLVWHLWQFGDPLQLGIYGIQEPLANAPQINPTEVDLILVPAVACDRWGYRLGYGGGFYDRMLGFPQWQNIPKIGIVFDFAFLPQLPVDPWDLPLNGVCTETECFFIS